MRARVARRTRAACAPRGRRTDAPQPLLRNPLPGHTSVARGRNWAPSDGDSSDDDAPRNAVTKRSGNPFQPLLDVMFKPVAELLCPMLMPASNDTLVREYCEELEKDRSVLAQQNVALEKELEKLKLSAAKRQRGKRSKDEQLDRFIDLRVMVRHPRSRHSRPRPSRLLRRRWATSPMAVQRTTWPSRCAALRCVSPAAGRLTPRTQTAWAAWDKRDRPTRERVAMRAASSRMDGCVPLLGGARLHARR